MSNENQQNEQQEGNQGLKISSKSGSYLAQTITWTKFLSILGFVVVGIILITALFAGTVFSFFSGEAHQVGLATSLLFGAVYVFIAIIYFFPALYLFRFATQLKSAIGSHDSSALEKAFENQKSFFKFWGVLIIVMLSFYVLSFIFGVLGSSLF